MPLRRGGGEGGRGTKEEKDGRRRWEGGKVHAYAHVHVHVYYILSTCMHMPAAYHDNLQQILHAFIQYKLQCKCIMPL